MDYEEALPCIDYEDLLSLCDWAEAIVWAESFIGPAAKVVAMIADAEALAPLANSEIVRRERMMRGAQHFAHQG